MAAEASLRNPFVGPVPFEREDADLFFGRVGEVQELISLIVANRVVVLYAASGAGKTSLLNAGVLPLLEREERFEVLPSARFSRLTADDEAARGIENVYVYTTLLNWSERTAEPSEAQAAPTAEMTLPDLLAARPQLHNARGRRLSRVVVFDQFEEIFTVHPEYWEHREGFFEQLADALDQDRYLRVVLALREDYLAQLEPLLPLLPSHVRFRLERLGRDGAIEAVTGPVARAGRSFGDGVAEALVKDLQTLRVDVGRAVPIETPGEFVEPVQLQVVCHSLWSELPPDTEQITQQHIHAFGDVDEVLQRFYDEAVTAAARTAHVRGRRLRQWVEDAFITSVGTRSTIYRTAESTAEIPNAAIEELENRHLIRGDWRAGARWYELTHDRFIGPVQSANSRFRAGISRRRRKRALTVGGVLAPLVVAVGAAWSFTSASPESVTPQATVSIKRVAMNVPFSSYQQVIGQKPSGSRALRQRRGNLYYLQVSSEGLRGTLLVITSSTVEAKSRRPVREGEDHPRATFTPESNGEELSLQIWIPLLSRNGRFAHSIVLRTAPGAVFDRTLSEPFTTSAQGTAVEPNVVLLELRVRKAGLGSGTVVSSPPGIDCGATCSAEFAKGTRVTLLAQPAPRSFLKVWGHGCGRGRTCREVVDRRTVVVADFARTFVDVVANTGGIGVRYRNSPKRSDLVPGNGPFEGDRVTIYCYTRGESVRGNGYWVKIKLAPDRYVPAAYLRSRSHSKPPAGVVAC